VKGTVDNNKKVDNKIVELVFNIEVYLAKELEILEPIVKFNDAIFEDINDIIIN